MESASQVQGELVERHLTLLLLASATREAAFWMSAKHVRLRPTFTLPSCVVSLSVVLKAHLTIPLVLCPWCWQRTLGLVLVLCPWCWKEEPAWAMIFSAAALKVKQLRSFVCLIPRQMVFTLIIRKQSQYSAMHFNKATSTFSMLLSPCSTLALNLQSLAIVKYTLKCLISLLN